MEKSVYLGRFGFNIYFFQNFLDLLGLKQFKRGFFIEFSNVILGDFYILKFEILTLSESDKRFVSILSTLYRIPTGFKTKKIYFKVDYLKKIILYEGKF